MTLHIWMLPFVVVCCTLSMSAAVKANVNSKVILQSVESLASGHQIEVSSLAHIPTNSSEPIAGSKPKRRAPPPIVDVEAAPNYQDEVKGLRFDPSGMFGREVAEDDEVRPVLLEQPSLEGSRCSKVWGAASDMNPTQQHRVMEDSMTVADPWISIGDKQFAFFAVYDGHGCADYSIWCQQNLHKVLATNLFALDAAALDVEPHPDDAVAGALSKTFLDVDTELQHTKSRRGGTTATVAVVRRQEEGTFLYVANVGDSNAVRISKSAKSPQLLSGIHRARLGKESPEMTRIKAFAEEKSVGIDFLVYEKGRLLGDIKVSRSLGDREAKSVMDGLIISQPDISVTRVITGGQHVVLGSDGLWDHMEPSHLKSVLDEASEFETVAGELVRSAKEKFGSDDNICCLVISF